MARRTFAEIGGVPAAIFAGEHDDVLDLIDQAIKARKRSMFRPGMTVRFNELAKKIAGQTGTILKVNPKTINVGVGEVKYEDWDARKEYGVWSGGEWNVSASLLEIVA